ncbi:manganese superoxide dismutase [Chiua virens]|nr:manganese superoxide dismutase [Chiua virens]
MLSIATRIALRPALKRAFARPLTGSVASVHTLPDLPYEYNALEPHISEQIMKLHHTKHHQGYVNGLNAAEKAYAESTSVQEKIALQSALKFNGGGGWRCPFRTRGDELYDLGHINHSLFWTNLSPANKDGGKLVDGPLKEALERDFGGWGWLGYNAATKKLEIVTTANQDPLISHLPILGVDIWEHAFYLQYHNVKADYLNAIWNVINFKEAEKRFLDATK